MIETTCECGAPFSAPESSVGQAVACQQCGQPVHLVAAEALPEGAGSGDFDAHLVIESGPARVGEQILIGGVADITLGKLPDKNVALPGGSRVSRFHCSIGRLDFGPSRWELRDNKSTNGVFVNGERVETQELRDGDIITIGEFELRFVSTYERDLRAADAAAAKATIAAGGAICPSCGKALAKGMKICVNCGVDVKTGRSLVVSKGLDEDDLAQKADTWIKVVSIIMPIGLFPIASDAFGTKKPRASFVLAALTTVASIMFLVAWMSAGDDPPSANVQNMMHWSGHPPTANEIDAKKKEYEKEFRGELEKIQRRARRRHDDDVPELSDKDIQKLVEKAVAEEQEVRKDVGFHWYQLFTSAMIHDPSGILPFVYHLGGNLVFFFVFGMRVNELVGNWKFAILYPLLALGSGLIDHAVHMNGELQAGLGASGAIMGLAGMYFVFFPVQRVYSAIWLRLRAWCVYKVFRMRGFWLLLLWIGFNDTLPVVLGWDKDGVGHWAHLGGFLTGMFLALVLLISRQVSAHGNDILSCILGKRAWALIGNPASRLSATA